MFAKVKERIDSTAKAAIRPTGNGGGHGGGSGDRPMPSIIGRDMRVIGNLQTPGEVHVEGIVDGDVSCTKLTIGATGAVNGHILATTVRVHGRVEGEINADEVFILNGSIVLGDVIQQMLEIAPGASFEGAIRRRGPHSQANAAPQAMLAAPVEATAPADATPAMVEPPLVVAEATESSEPLLLADVEPVAVAQEVPEGPSAALDSGPGVDASQELAIADPPPAPPAPANSTSRSAGQRSGTG